MDVRSIRFSIVQVVVILVQMVTVVWFIAGLENKIRNLTEITKDIRTQQATDAQSNQLWRVKVETDLVDLKVRVALLEAKISKLEK